MFTEENLTTFLSSFDKSEHEELLDVYHRSILKHLDIIKNALKSNDEQTLKNTMHDMKTFCYMLDATKEGELAEYIENTLIKNEIQKAFEKTPEAQNNFEHIEKIINNYKQLYKNKF